MPNFSDAAVTPCALAYSNASARCDGVYALATRGFLPAAGFDAGTGVGFVFTGTTAPRVTPAVAAQRLTQLCGTRCSRAAAHTPLARTVASTACLCSFV